MTRDCIVGRLKIVIVRTKSNWKHENKRSGSIEAVHTWHHRFVTTTRLGRENQTYIARWSTSTFLARRESLFSLGIFLIFLVIEFGWRCLDVNICDW